MKEIIGLHQALMSNLEKVDGFFFEDDAKILLVDVEAFVANKKEVVATIESGIPVIFFWFDTPERFATSGMSAAPYSHLRNTGYIQLPSNTVADLVGHYDRIVGSKNTENKALTLLSIVSAKRYLTNIFLHDLHPGKKDYKATLQKVNKDLGITGTRKQVREKLEVLHSRELRSKAVAELAKGEILPGVFCGIEVTLWTGGNVDNPRTRLAYNRIYYPLVSKYDFYDCKVETVIDDLTPEEFFKEYRIVASEYIQVK